MKIIEMQLANYKVLLIFKQINCESKILNICLTIYLVFSYFLIIMG